MSNIAKAEIILSRPEKRHAVEAFALAQHIARCRLSLPLRHHPVLDPYVLTCEWVGPTCDIADGINARRSEEHTSELQSVMRISYAVFFVKQNTVTPVNNYNL